MSLEAAITENTRALQALLAHLSNLPTVTQVAPAAEPSPKARKAKAEPAPVAEPAVTFYEKSIQPAAPAQAVKPTPVVEPAPAPVVPRSLPPDKAEIAALVSSAINKGLKEKARALFAKFKAPNISGVQEAHLAELADDLRALLATVSE